MRIGRQGAVRDRVRARRYWQQIGNTWENSPSDAEQAVSSQKTPTLIRSVTYEKEGFVPNFSGKKELKLLVKILKKKKLQKFVGVGIFIVNLLLVNPCSLREAMLF